MRQVLAAQGDGGARAALAAQFDQLVQLHGGAARGAARIFEHGLQFGVGQRLRLLQRAALGRQFVARGRQGGVAGLGQLQRGGQGQGGGRFPLRLGEGRRGRNDAQQ